MNTIGIIGAMDEEIALIKPKLELISAKEIIGLDFYLGRMYGNNVVLVRSGIGKVSAAICTQVLADMYGVDYVINVGVAGAVAEELDIGDIVVSSDVVHHDVDCTNFGYAPGVIPRLKSSYFEAAPELVEIARSACKAVTDKKVYVARIASGDQFVFESAVKQSIWDKFKAYCVEMEGAAIAQTASLNKIPFVIVRSISDKANEAATLASDEFMALAAKNSSEFVEEILKAL